MKKLIFFDLDGTLCDLETGIPESAKRALNQLRENEHMAFVCTGRSRGLVSDELYDLGIQGIISACGAKIEFQGNCIQNMEVPVQIAKKSVEVMRANHMIPVLEGPEYMYYDKDEYTEEIDSFVGKMTELLGKNWRPIKGFENMLHINKISAKRLPGCNVEAVEKELGQWYDGIWHDEGFVSKTIEYVVKGATKGKGIERMVKVVGGSMEDTMAFGDSNNDLSMFDYAKIKVAMGNASKSLKERADYITEALENDGVEKALKHFDLI